MSAPRKGAAPRHYLALEAALRLLEAGSVADVLIALRLERVDHPAARKAAALLRRGRWRGAVLQLEGALEALAGPDSGSGLSWFHPPVAEQVRDARKRAW